MNDEYTAKTKLAVRWLVAGLALMAMSCLAAVVSPVIQGAVLLAAVASVAMGIRHVRDTLPKTGG